MRIKKYPKLNQAQIIILAILVFFVSGAIYLFSIDSRYNDPRYNHEWFALSFSDSESASFDFTIENFSKEPDFHWEIFVEKDKMSEGMASIAPKSKKDIKIKADEQATGRITIRVSSKNETREIYRNIN